MAPKAAKGKTTSTLRGPLTPPLNATAAQEPNYHVEEVIHISDEDLQRAKQAFFQIDRDGSGSIDKEEVGAILKGLGKSPSDAELQSIIDEVEGLSLNRGESSDGNGKIEMREYLKWYAKIINSETDIEDEDVMDVFRALGGNDCSKDTVSKDAVKKLLMSQYELDAQMDEVLGPDDKINYEKFKTILTQGAAQRSLKP